MSAEFLIGVTLFLGLMVVLEGGYRLGCYAARAHDKPAGGQLGAVQGAMLGLLGLLLGFSFAGAAERFLERQHLIVEEANAIGTTFLRADLLDEPHRTQLREALAGYVAHRLEIALTLRYGLSPQVADRIRRFHNDIWKATRDGTNAKPAAMVPVVTSVNEVLDLHDYRLAAARKHLPIPVLVLLVVSSVLAIGDIGYGCGLSKRRSLLITGPLVFLVAAALWITIDLDHPRAGLIQLSDLPLQELELK